MQDWIYKLQQSKNFVAIVGLLLVVWLGYNTTVITLRNYELVQQIDELEDEIAILQLENENLQFQKGYYQTNAFLELEARDKLNKVEPGEKLLILPDDRYENLISSAEPSSDDSLPAAKNFRAWMDFLVGGKR